MSREKTIHDVDQTLARVGGLFNETEDVGHLTPGQIDSELKRHGIDATKSLAALRERLAVIERRQKIQTAGAKRKALLQSLAGNASKAIAATRAEIESLLESLKASNPDAAQVYACRLEKATEADLESLKHDIEVVRKMKHAAKRHD